MTEPAEGLSNRCTIEEALTAAERTSFPRLDLLRKLAERARGNGRSEEQARCSFRSSDCFFDLQAWLLHPEERHRQRGACQP